MSWLKPTIHKVSETASKAGGPKTASYKFFCSDPPKVPTVPQEVGP